MGKIKRFISAHRFFFFTYFTVLLYNLLLVNNGRMGSIFYSYHSVDFSMGFCTKLLPGAIYHLLVGVYNHAAIATYVRILFAIFWLIVCVLFERFYFSVEKKYKPSALFLCALLVLGPLSLSMYAREMGMLDFYWALFFFVSLLLVKSRIGKFFIPVFIFAMVLTHYGSILCYIPALLLIILYLTVTAESKREKKEYAILFAVGLVVALVSTGYFLAFEKSNLTYTVEQFNKILDSRGVDFKAYYDFVFYRHYEPYVVDSGKDYSILEIPVVETDSPIKNVIAYVAYQIKFNIIATDFKKDWYIYIVTALLAGFLVYLLVKCFKSASRKSEKAVIALMIAFSPFVLGGWIFSADIVRWLALVVVVLLVFIFVIAGFGKENVALKSIEKFINTVRPKALAVIMFVYAFLPYSPFN